jgi:predicted transcriptional regulator
VARPARPKSSGAPRPTDAELEFLRVLWRIGRGTVAQVHEQLDRGRPTGYTTVLKILQIMHEKGLVRRDDRTRPHVYEPAISERKTKAQLIADLAMRAFGGSAARLAVHALSERRASPEELAEIRRILDEMEGGRR